MNGLTILAHVHNEALLLPYWLRHHRRIFDHGVIVDRGSTDGTREIIAELAPEWEVVPSRSAVFDAVDCDREMMELESRYAGWKIVLNATEFLFHDDPRGYLANLERADPDTAMVAIPMAVMVDPPELGDGGLDPTIDLWRQRFHGYVGPKMHRFRFLHRHEDGAYGVGRHDSRHQYRVLGDLGVLRYSWSPYPAVRHRKIEVQKASAASDAARGLGYQHWATAAQLDAQYAEETLKTVDLRTVQPYGSIHRRLTEQPERPFVRPVSTRIDPEPPRAPLPVTVVGTDDRAVSLAKSLGGSSVESAHLVPPVGVAIATPDVLMATELIFGRSEPIVVDLTDSPKPSPGQPWGSTLVDALARADYILCASDQLRDQWLAPLASAGRIAVPFNEDPEVLSVAADPTAPGALDAVREFIRRPVRRGVPVFVDNELLVSEAHYRVLYRLSMAVTTGLGAARERIAELEATLATERAEAAQGEPTPAVRPPARTRRRWRRS